MADEDPFALAATLEQVLTDRIAHPRDSKWERMRQAGYDTAARYSTHRQQRAILDFWNARIGH